MEKSVHCEVRTKGRALPQAVSRRPVTAGTRIQSQVIPCENCCLKTGNGTGFFRVNRVSPANIIPPVLHTHFQLHVAPTRTKGRRMGTFERRKALFKFK